MNHVLAELVTQIFTIAAAALGSGAITTLLTQLLKWQVIRIPAQKYPVHTAAALSLVVSAGAVYILDILILNSVAAYFVFAAATLLVATQTYDLVKKALGEQKGGSDGRS